MRKALLIVAILAMASACKKEKQLPGGAESAKPATDTKAGAPPAQPDVPAPPDVAAAPADAEKTPSGLASKVLAKGTGTEKPQPQDRVKVNYTGWTTDGKMFDTSTKRGGPATFGVKQVIPGWTEGLQLMVVGEKRRLWIPKEIAYNGMPGKPEGMLVFDVELVEIMPGPKPIPAPADVAKPPADATKEKSGISWKTTQKGTGKEHPSADAYVTFHFTVWTDSGEMLQTSVTSHNPLTLPLDKGIPAWKEVIPQMVVGEKRLIWSPDDPAFKGRPGAKPGEMAVYEIELVSFKEAPKAPADVAKPPKDAQKTDTGIFHKVLTKGTGKDHPKAEDTVEVHYTGWTTDGKMFDSSVMRGKPARFPLKGVIPGWTEGVQLMVVGEKRRLWIPKELAYNDQPGAPAGTLVFDIELISINPPPAAPPGVPGKPVVQPEGEKPAADKPADKPADKSGATKAPADKPNQTTVEKPVTK